MKALLDRLPGAHPARLKWYAAAGVLLVVLFAWLLRPRASAESTEYYEVRRGVFTVSIVEGGALAAVSEVSIRSEVEGTARIIYLVPEGTFVKEGDLLVQLDSAQAEDQVNQQQINFEKARFGLIQAQEELAIQKSTVDSEIRTSEMKVRVAKLDLEKFEEGQQMVSLIEASNKLVQAEAQLAVNLEKYYWTTNLHAKGFETKQVADADRLSVLNTRNSLIIATNTIWMLEKYDIPKEREQLLSALRVAENDLLRVQAQSKANIAQAEADLLTQANTLTLNSNKLARDRRNLANTSIRAPQDGLVVFAVNEGRFSSESLIEEGATVRNRQEIIKLPDTSRMKVTVRVHESHVNMIRAGLPAYVILDSMPDVRFAGRIERVALLPDTQMRWANPNLKVYNTDVLITDALPDVKPGVSAKAEIIITNIAEALSVPIQAVTTLRGRQVVYVQNRGEAEPRPVEVGMYNTRFIQIISGVREGDRVLLAPPFDSQSKDIEGEILSPDEKAKVSVTNAPASPSTPPGAPPAPLEETSKTPPREPSLAAAGEAAAELAQRPASRSGGAPRFNPEEMLKQYDKDGDGQLSAEERETMRAAFGAQGGGSRFNREEMLRRFDKDGDGQLSEEERAAMRQGRGGRSEGREGARPSGPRNSESAPGQPAADAGRSEGATR
jgi:HlyD family secretion protein